MHRLSKVKWRTCDLEYLFLTYMTSAGFYDEVDVMRSLAKPRKITILGSNGKIYMFLGKPKDDLRKDARLMDFNSIINKLLKTNSESRRRQLRMLSLLLSSISISLSYRYQNVLCCYIERRVWIYPMGSKHYSYSTGPIEVLRCQGN